MIDKLINWFKDRPEIEYGPYWISVSVATAWKYAQETSSKIQNLWNVYKDLMSKDKVLPPHDSVLSPNEIKEGWEIQYINNIWMKVLPRDKVLK